MKKLDRVARARMLERLGELARKPNSIHVIRSDRGWAVTRAGAKRATRVLPAGGGRDPGHGGRHRDDGDVEGINLSGGEHRNRGNADLVEGRVLRAQGRTGDGGDRGMASAFVS
ncbi:MAG: hypothetical protein GY856_23750 [bacterium]|nr:hypothetical protein [bacterium]